MGKPTRTEKDRLIKLYAQKLAAQEQEAPMKAQQRAHDKFFEALDKVLRKYDRGMLNQDEFDALEAAARNWTKKQMYVGPAKDW